MGFGWEKTRANDRSPFIRNGYFIPFIRNGYYFKTKMFERSQTGLQLMLLHKWLN